MPNLKTRYRRVALEDEKAMLISSINNCITTIMHTRCDLLGGYDMATNATNTLIKIREHAEEQY